MDTPASKTIPQIVLCAFVAAAVILLDRATKIFFMSFLREGETLPVIPDVFHFTLVHNTGIAFGLFKDQGAVFIVIPLVVVVLLAYNLLCFARQHHRLSMVYLVSFSLILGGAVGNLIDRMVYGYVVDFLDFRVWPVFNVADSAITIGALLLAWHLLRHHKESREEQLI